MDIRLAFRIDQDTKSMLQDLLDLHIGMHGRGIQGDVVIALLREEHRKRFPEDWIGGVYRHYTRSKHNAHSQTA